ncbi:hypothetical protein NL50_17315 [Clostridium acetobutylicum]|nr:hypothetical protein NL50_17315 [Clostridium acetobutylicum]
MEIIKNDDRLDIENKLRNYYTDIKKINILEEKIKSLKSIKERIEDNIRHCDIKIEADLNMGVSYGEKVQTSSTGTGYAEGQIIKQIERQEKKAQELQEEITRTLLEISDLSSKNAILKSILDRIGHVYIDIIEMYYKRGMSNRSIGMGLNLDERTIRNKKKEALRIIKKLIG